MDDRDYEQRLVERAAAGEREAAEQLLQLHLPRLRAFVRLRMGPGIAVREAESDVVQSVCVEILRNVERFRHPAEGAFRRWLYTTALRKIVRKNDYHRAERRNVDREEDPEAKHPGDDGLLAAYGSFSTPSRVAMAHEEAARIEGAFAALAEDEQQIILLSRVAGLAHADVAEQLGKSVTAVRSRLHRALGRLSGLLEKSD